MKKTALILAIVCIISCLSGCSLEDRINVKNLVAGDIESGYLGTADAKYRALTGSSTSDIIDRHRSYVETEAEYFAYYWDITDDNVEYEQLSYELREDIEDLIDDIYSHLRYRVEECVQYTENLYGVRVQVAPIDIMERATKLYNNGYKPLEDFLKKAEKVDFSKLSEERFMSYYNEYGAIITEMVRSCMSELGYKDSVSLVIQVYDDGYFQSLEHDWSRFDNYTIEYP